MSHAAQVRSIAALEELAAALRSLSAEMTVALEDLGMDLHRAIQWIEHDQRDYWAQEYRRAQEAVTEARIALERKRSMKIGDRQPSCDEEKKALEMAKRRVERARQKVETVRRWGRLLEHEATECRSGIAPLARWVETDVPRALSMLKHMSEALESYVGATLSRESIAGSETMTVSEPMRDGAAGGDASPRGPAGAEPAEPSSSQEPGHAGM